MRYIIPLVNGSYTEGDSAIVTEGTRNDTSEHYIAISYPHSAGGSVSIQKQVPGSVTWVDVARVSTGGDGLALVKSSGVIAKYRFVVESVSSPVGVVEILDSEYYVNGIISSVSSTREVILTQAEYDAISTPDENTKYIIVG